jgi:hypothetical protein
MTNDWLQIGFLGKWNLLQNSNYKQFFVGGLEKRSRLNKLESNSRSGFDQMMIEICFETKWRNRF